MEMSDLITWVIGVAVTVLVAAWGRVAAKISRNTTTTAALGAEVAALRSRVDVHDAAQGDLTTEIRNVHARIGGVARTTDQISGQMLQIGGTLTVIHEHLLQRENKAS